MISVYRFKKDNKTIAEGTGASLESAQEQAGITSKDYDSYEPLPGKSLTNEMTTEEPARIISEDGQTGVATGANAPKTRKTRTDKGQPHKKSDKPEPKKRDRGQFFVLTDNGQKMAFNQYPTIEALRQFLSDLSPGTEAKIVRGYELTFMKKVQITLKPIK